MSLTIKQAFEALSDACANGMKNPFFVMRRLKESFADVASKVDGGGSEVTVTPVVTEGTKIATITVDKTAKDIYAPALSDYSTTEYDTGRKWIDGSTIYGKILPVGATSFTKFEWTTLYTDESISSISQLIDARIIQPVNKGAYCAFNFKADGTSIKGLYLETLSLSSGSYVVIEYTKSST